jgi:glycyl-tRNA synthetase
MSPSQTAVQNNPTPDEKINMNDLVSLCKRRGFIFAASEIYGGINGFWDFGPLGIQLKNNLRDRWWRDMVIAPPMGPDGKPLQILGLDSAIIQNPKTWAASGHIDTFNDPMVDCKKTKLRYRQDHLVAVVDERNAQIFAFYNEALEDKNTLKKLKKQAGTDELAKLTVMPFTEILAGDYSRVIGPDTDEKGTLTEPRKFNLMFKTYVGATASEDDMAYLRPETAQGIFLNYKNVLDSSRVRVPFGIAQIGKAFRNEVTPRNFIFRSREFEQMEMEWFCPPDEAKQWAEFWIAQRHTWWQSVGVAKTNLQLRTHDRDELSHYAKAGVGTTDIEYKFPFTDPNFGELEGIAHRCDFDLTQHEKFSGTKMEYFDDSVQPPRRFIPHVIEPAAGLTRGVLTLLAEAYTVDASRPSGIYMKFKPSMAPVKAAILPLVNKDGLPEIAEKLYLSCRTKFVTEYDVKGNIGKRYARHDEIGTPFCITVDTDTLSDHAVTVRHRDTMKQERVGLDKIEMFVLQAITD